MPDKEKGTFSFYILFLGLHPTSGHVFGEFCLLLFIFINKKQELRAEFIYSKDINMPTGKLSEHF